MAEAARQEQTRKQSQQKKSKHVYTDEDLKRAQILTPEDRAEVEARKAQQPLPGMGNAQDALDAEALPAGEPLGDVARRYRKERELLKLQQTAQFHLPFIEETVHATPRPSLLAEIKPPALDSPKPSVMPLRTIISIPAPPPRVEPFQPPVKRSPFERPRIFLSAPRVAPSQPSANHMVPPQPPAVSATPARPSTIPITPAEPAAPAVHTAPSHAATLPVTASKPAAPAHDLKVMPVPAAALHVPPVQPALPKVPTVPVRPSSISVAPSGPAAPKPDLSVMPAPAPAARMTPVQPSAPIVPTAPARASTISVAPSKPTAPVRDFNVMPAPRPVGHVASAQPAAPVVPPTSSQPSVISVTPSKPAAPAPDLSAMPAPAAAAHSLSAPPVAPVIRPTPSKPSPLGVTPSQPAAPVIPVAPPRVTSPSRTPIVDPARRNVLTVQPGDSLWKLAQQNLGDGLRWHDLLVANPAIVDPNHIVAGSHIFLPSIASRYRTATSIIVQKGDTLSQIARTQLGHAAYWSCIAHANPAVHDANLIYEGQTLVLPGSCKP